MMRDSRSLALMCGAAVAATCIALGCSLAPVVTAPQMESTLYDDCQLAAENYCELVIGASEDELEACVAKHTFQCVSGVSD